MPGEQACGPAGGGACAGGVQPDVEGCDGLDQDCDGRVDEDACVCPLDDMRDCGSDVGACAFGRQLCGPDGWGLCVDAVEPVAEQCNGLDDDCDGASDEGWPDLGALCFEGVGACRGEGQRVCAADGHSTQCSAVAGMPQAGDICNGIDDDCDRRVDEGVAVVECETDRPGACRAGRLECLDGAMQCRSVEASVDEVCDGVDRDCDGTVDESFRAAVVQTTYVAMAGFHPVCDGEAQRVGADCNAAIHRACGADRCHVSGFGPVELVGGDLTAVCVSGAALRVVPFAELSDFGRDCRGVFGAYGHACSAAIHTWCRARGFVTGFGPVESREQDADVACLQAPAEVRQTTFDALQAQHPECNGRRDVWTTACNAAIHRWCRTQGFTSGYGPVEPADPQVVTVVCVAD